MTCAPSPNSRHRGNSGQISDVARREVRISPTPWPEIAGRYDRCAGLASSAAMFARGTFASPMTGGPDPAQLLQRHLPVLRYDSQEPYFADAASEWTDNPGNVLRRADGSVLAAATPSDPDEPQLSLDFLGAPVYANGVTALRDDRIGDPSHNYAAQAQALHAKPQYANRVYGHWATGSDNRVWLAYWFFYFYNDYNLIGPLIKAGLHEGDWEMIQLRLDPAGQAPDLAVYAQHKHAGQRPWDQVERVGDQPVVYPARGSHASYFSAGVHWTGAWFDFADGNRPGPALTLHVISDTTADDEWARWPGSWGGTEPPSGDINPLDDASPRGPGRHAQYTQPDVLLDTAAAHAADVKRTPPPAPPPPAPTVTTTTEGNDLNIAFDTHVPNPAGLVVTIGDPGAATPPEIHRIPVTASAGTATIKGAGSDALQTVHVSVATEGAAATPATSSTAQPPAQAAR